MRGRLAIGAAVAASVAVAVSWPGFASVHQDEAVTETAITTDSWVQRPANYSVSATSYGGHPVTYPLGAVFTEDTDPGAHVEGIRYDDTGPVWLVFSIPDPDPDESTPRFQVHLSAPVSLLTRGGVYRTKRINDQGKVSLDITQGSAGCGSSAPGRVDILGGSVDSRGRVSRLWFRYEFGCDGPTALMTGEVRWGYPEAARETAPTAMQFGSAQPETSSPVVAIRLHRAPGMQFRTLDIRGRNAARFTVVADRCVTNPQRGPECVIRLRFRPVRAGFHNARLVVSDAEATVRVQLEGMGLPGIYRMVFDSDPASAFGDRHADVTPATAKLVSFVRELTPQERFGAFYQDESGQGFWLELNTRWNERFGTGTFEVLSESNDGLSLFLGYGGVVTRGCDTADRGIWTVHQAHRGRAPAYNVEVTHWCEGAEDAPTNAHIWYGARPDETGPDAATNLKVIDGRRLTWQPPADAVLSVVRIRRGGKSSTQVDTGELIHAGTANTATIPEAFRNRAVTLNVFTLDAQGNISAPAKLTT